MARDLLPRKFTEQDEEAANEGETLPEKQPLLGGPPQAAETGAAKSAPMLAWASAVIMASTCLINYNKIVMQPGNFPFAVPLVMLHSFCGTMFALILLLVRPSFFPSLTDPDKKVTIDFEYILRSTSPVALCFTASLVLSNTAYQFASVAFLQMLKQGNVILVFGFSLMAGLEVLRLRSVLLICGILAATGLTVKGEMNSSVVGLFVQLSCCIFESAKIVIQGILLSGTGKKLDPMSYLLIISPQCFLLLSGVVACHTFFIPVPTLVLPAWSNFVECRWLLAGNVLVAFSLNYISASFLRVGSPMAFLMVNIIKDVMIVTASAIVMHAPISSLQMVSFPVQLSLILIWSLIKAFPQNFEENGVAFGLASLVRSGKDK
eukprot:CAMPEP_0115072136 /NCGR_PEP_ID=MMETSP0227-20121206/14057_1 /TAXON_ID=89957 /ORGANISM="Polarella glacialis, Strain CCMP 1383" /LENGTH=376 /DNA_ID=CAMNT_0002458839 /DNA_START=85 /DNA_END=1215 /DNA_ORIENTATION=+